MGKVKKTATIGKNVYVFVDVFVHLQGSKCSKCKEKVQWHRL